MASSILPPTLIIPLSSIKGLRDLNLPYSNRPCRVSCACLIQKVSAPCSSSGFRGPFFLSCAFLLSRIFSASQRILAVTRISFLQLEKVDGSIISLAFTVETVTTIWRRSMSSSGVGGEVIWFGHTLFCRRSNAGPLIHLSFSAFTWIPCDRSSATLSSLGIYIH